MALPGRSLSFVVALWLAASVAACAPKPADFAVSPAPAAASVPAVCDRSDQDTSTVAHVALYQACAVDVSARPIGQRPPAFRPTTGRTCFFVEFEVVVDTAGTAEPGSMRILETNDMSYARAARALVPTMRFTPAHRDGRPVRQVMRMGFGISRSPPTRTSQERTPKRC